MGLLMDHTASHVSRGASWGDRLSYVGFLAGLSFLLFVLGSLAADQNWIVAQHVRDASQAAQALLAQNELNGQRYPKYLWFPTENQARGLTQRDAEKMQPGYTLYTSGDAAQATLLDESGNIVHRWDAPFSSIWPAAGQLQGWTSDHAVFIRRAHALPNGDLLALYESPSQTPNGCGLAKLDRHSGVIWTFDENAHHDFDVAADGRIFALTHQVRRRPLENWDQLLMPVIEEFLTILSPDGQVIKRLSLFELLGRSPFHRPLVTHTDQLGDVLHSNTVQVIGAEFAAKHRGVNAGDALICLRNLNLLVAVNCESESIDWAYTGPWRLPHDPDPLDDGTLLIFDNCFARGARHGSRVLRYDLQRGAAVWQYSGGKDAPLRSDIRSCQQLLAGGNVLITESDRGRLVEVAPDGRIVWEYVHPVRGGEAGELIPIVSGARRYDTKELPFLRLRSES